MSNTGRIVGINGKTGRMKLQLDPEVPGGPEGGVIEGELRVMPGGRVQFVRFLERFQVMTPEEATAAAAPGEEAERERLEHDRENIERARRLHATAGNRSPD